MRDELDRLMGAYNLASVRANRDGIDEATLTERCKELGAAHAALRTYVASLRAAVRAADAVFASQDHPVFAKGEEKALATYREARAKCEPGKERGE